MEVHLTSLLPDSSLESQTGDFEDFGRTVNTKALRLGIVITAAVQVPFLLFEWLALREQVLSVQALRALWLAPAVALYLFLRKPWVGLPQFTTTTRLREPASRYVFQMR